LKPLAKNDAVASPLIRPYEEQIWFDAIPGERLSIRVHSSEVGGKFSIMENVADDGAATPLHVHREDEVFHIVEGEVVFSLDGELATLGVGGCVLIPAGTPHAWRNKSGRPVRMVAFFSPGGVEDLFVEIEGCTPAEIAELAGRYGTAVVGPPIDAS
jgi:mannose-6-phosphate isomerase-like protein (cupin superfamily)